MKYRKKPVVIEAVQWNGNSNLEKINDFVGKELKVELESETAYIAGAAPPIFNLLIETKEGVMKAMKGDYIIKEPFPTGDRDFYPCKPDIFEQTYESVIDLEIDTNYNLENKMKKFDILELPPQNKTYKENEQR